MIAGFHSMCNGANLAYSKSVFNEVNGFKDVDAIASGDDMLLMQKIKQHYPGSIGYLFSSQVTVATQPEKTWKDFLTSAYGGPVTSYNDHRYIHGAAARLCVQPLFPCIAGSNYR